LIYIFGGMADDRLNDLWRFNLRTNSYERVKDSEDMRPNVRSGHSMNFFDGKLYVFGGIHEVTWELDDLHIFDIKVQKLVEVGRQLDHTGSRFGAEERVRCGEGARHHCA